MAQGSLTARPTSQAGAKAGLSDPAVACGSAVAQRIKGTPGITGSSCPSVHSDGKVWHLKKLGCDGRNVVKASAYNGEPRSCQRSPLQWAIPWEVSRTCSIPS